MVWHSDFLPAGQGSIPALARHHLLVGFVSIECGSGHCSVSVTMYVEKPFSQAK